MKLKSYSIEFKLKVIEYAEEKGNHAAGREFQVDRKSIRTWRKSKDKLLDLSAGSVSGATRKRLKGGGRKVHDANFEKILLEWVYAVASEGRKIRAPVLIAHAQELQLNHKEAKGLNFSNGWLEKFINRNKLQSLMSSEQSSNVNHTLSRGQQKPPSHLNESVDVRSNSMVGIVQNIPSFDHKSEALPAQQDDEILSKNNTSFTKGLVTIHGEDNRTVNCNPSLLITTEDSTPNCREHDHEQPPVFILDD
uniref:Putative transposase n=1 Tax=Clytia hemisphaerica TaxID=252671 RepID=A0A069DV30_9CNID